jgi:tol-pal system protein YbgF
MAAVSVSAVRMSLLATVVATVCASAPAVGQSARELDERVRRLEQAVQALGKGQRPGTPEAPGAELPEAADLTVRILKLEQLVEQLTGQIEETRFRAGQTAGQLEQLSNDVNYRLAVLEQAAGVAGAVAGAPPPASGAAVAQRTMPSQTPRPPAPTVASPLPGATDGALSRPMTPQPAATPVTVPATAPAGQSQVAGAFGQLRTDSQGRPLPPDPNQPTAPPVDTAPAAPAPAPARVPNPGAVAATQLGVESGVPVDVALPEGTPKQQYDYAFDFLKRQDYGRAEAAFREFMKRYPKDALAGNAQYWLGETYYVRNDLQKSVIEFMNGYQNYPKSNKAPDNLLKLGMSLSRLGQGKEACTALGRLTKEYPDAPEQIRRNAQQERTRLKCA